MKKCTKCGIEKDLTEFNKRSKSKDNLSNVCKSCRKLYRKENSERTKLYMEKYREENSERIKKVSDEYDKNNKEKKNLKSREYYYDNKEHMYELNQIWRKNNGERLKELNRNHYAKHKSRKKHIKAWRSLLRKSLERMYNTKDAHTIDLLKYSAQDLKQHLESLFAEGMSWDNHGEWHIDHKIPLTEFPKDTPPHIVNSLINLQPLWAHDNISKSNKVLEEFKSMYIYQKYCV